MTPLGWVESPLSSEVGGVRGQAWEGQESELGVDRIWAQSWMWAGSGVRTGVWAGSKVSSSSSFSLLWLSQPQNNPAVFLLWELPAQTPRG